MALALICNFELLLKLVFVDFMFSFAFVLASRGLFYAAQFCYMVAQVPFGHYCKKSSKIVLLGSSHRCFASGYLWFLTLLSEVSL